MIRIEDTVFYIKSQGWFFRWTKTTLNYSAYCDPEYDDYEYDDYDEGPYNTEQKAEAARNNMLKAMFREKFAL